MKIDAQKIIDAMRAVDDPVTLAERNPTDVDYAELFDALLAILDECGVDRRVAFPMPEKEKAR
jgi:hypothetical protein